jgi:hypothetical protein
MTVCVGLLFGCGNTILKIIYEILLVISGHFALKSGKTHAPIWISQPNDCSDF